MTSPSTALGSETLQQLSLFAQFGDPHKCNMTNDSRIAGPMCPVLDPAMLTTVNFFHGNVFYIVWRAKLAWLLLARH